MALTLKYDPDADAVYIRLRDLLYAFGEDIDHERRIDYAKTGELIGVEILCASDGIHVAGLPFQDSIARLAEEHSFKVYA
jgi:uncharacterized protein YuzE